MADTDGSYCVLVVDDDAAIRELLSRALSLGGYRVVTAADGLSAVDTIVDVGPDLLLLDASLPGLDGFGVVERVRCAGVEIPVILLSAGDQRDWQRPGAEHIAVRIQKPFSVAALLAQVAEFLV